MAATTEDDKQQGMKEDSAVESPTFGDFGRALQSPPNIQVRRRRSPGSFFSNHQQQSRFASPKSTDSSDADSMTVILEPDDDDNSQDDADDDDNVDEKVDTSALHSLCRTATTVADLQRIGSLISVETASDSDQQGRTALHVLSHNQALAQAISGLGSSIMNSASSSSQWKSFLSSRGVLDRAVSTATSSSSSNISIGMSLNEPQLEMEQVSEVVELLWRAYPPAMITTDNQGHIPFEGALREWVDTCYENDETTSQQQRSSSRSLSSGNHPVSMLPSLWELKDSVTSRWVNAVGTGYYQNHRNSSKSTLVTGVNQQDTTTAGGAKTTTTTDLEAGLAQSTPNTTIRDRTFPRRVRMTAHALYSIKMLSMLLDRMEAATNSSSELAVASGNDKNSRSLYCSSRKRHTKMRGRSLLDELQNITVQDMSASIVHSVACITDLIKTILFMVDLEQRNQCIGTVLMRRVLTSKHSVGSWLTGMLQSPGKQASDLALDYLHIVSNASFDDADNETATTNKSIMTTSSIIRQKRSEDANKSRDEFYEEVSRLQDFVPSLLSLGEKQIEEAATTKVVQQVLDRIISRPFAVTVVFCDALIFGYRRAIDGVLLGKSPGNVLWNIYLANIGTFYFVIREIGKAISLCMITRRARVYVTFWNLIDLVATILVLVSTVAMRSQYSGLRVLCAVTTGFMWLRVLSYLKGINMQLATYVLAIIQVRRRPDRLIFYLRTIMR